MSVVADIIATHQAITQLCDRLKTRRDQAKAEVDLITAQAKMSPADARKVSELSRQQAKADAALTRINLAMIALEVMSQEPAP